MKEFRGGMTMLDKIEQIGLGSTIQHGKNNDRIYLMKLDTQDCSVINNLLSQLAIKNNYGKIFCKIPKSTAPVFLAQGFVLEAFIPKFYNRKEDVFFVSKYLCSDRLMNVEQEQLSILHQLLSENNSSAERKPYAPEYTLRKLGKNDIGAITDIYKTVFDSYPFPIFDPAYIEQTMDENVQYFGAEFDGTLAALSSSEIDFKGGNAEMTDFATHPEHLGKRLSCGLLELMEIEMKQQNITTLYTIARLNSIPMNKTFLRYNYEYSGTLIKNTNIAGKIESMNVYYKHL